MKQRTTPPVLESLEQRQCLAADLGDLVRAGSPGERLTRGDVERILAAAASQALPTQIISVVDREGEILGVYAGKDARPAGAKDQTGAANLLLNTVTKSITRARTGAFFASRENAFSTRTARFIIQDNFPFPVPNTPGGPLYGVQFSTLPFSDFSLNSLGTATAPAISGDPGGLPLFKNGEPVGGIGVAGDGSDRLAREDLPFDPRVSQRGNVFAGTEEKDFDEAVALAGHAAFAPPKEIQADRILIDGLRFTYIRDKPAAASPSRSLQSLLNAGEGRLLNPDAEVGLTIGRNAAKTRGSPIPVYPKVELGGIIGEIKNQRTAADASNRFGFVSGNDDIDGDGSVETGENLTVKDVRRIISQATEQALITRAGIREPIGVPARVHVAVVDRNGDALGVFRMDDGTNFSYDVAIQKARTAAFFSDDTHAFSSRAVGFMSQKFFPPGIVNSGGSPLFRVQNALSLAILRGGGFASPRTPGNNPLANGITIFPGGVPLYKNGQLVGAVGISGDGVDQDDVIAFAGTRGFRPDPAIRSDAITAERAVARVESAIRTMFDLYDMQTPLSDATLRRVVRLLGRGLDGVRLPYVKFPRNLEV